MGRICPILNHPLNDGVLVNDEALVSFIQKRNVDFLAHEYVCRSCKREVEKLYKKKLKRATELHRSRYHDASVSTLKTSRDSISSGASSTSEHSVKVSHRKRAASEDITQNGKGSSISETSLRQQNVTETVSANIIAVSETSVQILASYNNEGSILQENQQNLANIQQNTPANDDDTSTADNHKHVTLRKRTIRDFYTPKPQKPNEAAVALNTQVLAQTIYQTEIHALGDSVLNNEIDNDVIRRTSQEPTTSKAAAAAAAAASNANTKDTVTPLARGKPKTIPKTTSTVKKKAITRHVTYDMELENDVEVNRRLSQEPTTSKAAAAANMYSNKRPISAVIDSDDEDDRALSINAYNGTRLPHIQPLPPKRKSQTDKPSPIARDIMDEYIKNITGG